MKLYIGVTKEDELIYIEWDKAENEQRKTFSLSGGSYAEPITEQDGEDEARKRLSTSDYWDDIGFLDNKTFLTQYINFNDVAEHVINNDGWEMTNGEYSHFGEYEGEEIYLNFCSCGQHQEDLKNIKKLWISEKEYKTIISFWNKDHLKGLKINHLDFFNLLFDKYKDLCSEQEVLFKYLNCIKWPQ